MDQSTGLDQVPAFRSSTFSTASFAPKRVVKYGTGKYSKTGLVPQPSDSDDDPLNWPTWKKDLNLLGILFSVAMAGVLKTTLVTVNSSLAVNMNVSYTKVSALTAVPLIVSAFAGVLSLLVSRMVGKRTVYLGSAILMLIGSLWNTSVGHSYSQFLGARVFQGIGMGAFNTVVLSSIQEMYFEHERSSRITLYNTVMLGTTWGAPILEGYRAQSAGGILPQFTIISIFQFIGVVLLILLCTETSFYRSTTESFPSSAELDSIIPLPQKSKLSSYISSLHPMPYFDAPSISLLTQPLRYLGSPKTGLLFLMSGLLQGIAFAIGNSLPLLYSALPMLLFSTKIGYLFALPFILSILTNFLVATYFTSNPTPTYTLPTRTISETTNTLVHASPPKPSPKKQLFITLPAVLFGVSGLVAFGFYNSSHTHILVSRSGLNHQISTTTMMIGDDSMSLQIISFLFGLIVTGGVMLQISASAYITTSASPVTSDAVYRETALQFYSNVLMGGLVMGLPGWLRSGGSEAFVRTFGGVGGMQVGLVVVAVVGLGLGVCERWVERGEWVVLGREKEGEEKWRGGGSFMEV